MFWFLVIFNKILDMLEIGTIGDESNIVTFDISEDYVISKYDGFKTDKTLLNKLEISDKGKFTKI